MASPNTRRIATALIVAIVIFLVAIILPRIFVTGITIRLATTQGLELMLSLLAIVALGNRRFSDYGFCLPRTNRPRAEAFLRWIPVGLAAMALGCSERLTFDTSRF